MGGGIEQNTQSAEQVLAIPKKQIFRQGSV
jgi:hypothetical protein